MKRRRQHHRASKHAHFVAAVYGAGRIVATINALEKPLVTVLYVAACALLSTSARRELKYLTHD